MFLAICILLLPINVSFAQANKSIDLSNYINDEVLQNIQIVDYDLDSFTYYHDKEGITYKIVEFIDFDKNQVTSYIYKEIDDIFVLDYMNEVLFNDSYLDISTTDSEGIVDTEIIDISPFGLDKYTYERTENGSNIIRNGTIIGVSALLAGAIGGGLGAIFGPGGSAGGATAFSAAAAYIVDKNLDTVYWTRAIYEMHNTVDRYMYYRSFGEIFSDRNRTNSIGSDIIESRKWIGH